MFANVRSNGGETHQTHRTYAHAHARGGRELEGMLGDDAIAPPVKRRRLRYAKVGTV